jgi:site-specific recombinase XerD
MATDNATAPSKPHRDGLRPAGSETAAQLPVAEAIALYLAHKRRRGRRPHTIRQTDMVLRAFRRWSGDDSPAAITLRDVEFRFFPEWEEDFESRNHRHPSPSLARSLRIALRGLYEFLDRFDLLTDEDGAPIRNPLRNLDVPSAAAPHREHLGGEAAAKLLATAGTPRQKIVLNLLRWTGLRAGEAVSLADDDVDLERREIRVRTSKTPRGRRTIPLLPQLEEPIREWRAYRAEHGLNQPGSPFLVTMAGAPMQTRYVWRIVRDVAARAGLSTAGGRRVTPHALRRTFATEMLNRGVRLETVSRLLGHAATTITEQAYAQLTDHRIRAEVEEALSTGVTPPVSDQPRGEVGSAVSEQPRATLTVASSSALNGKLILGQGSRTSARLNRKTKRTTLAL